MLDLLISIALTVVLVLFLRLADHVGDVWPAPSESRFELGWPRGVQEEEPVRFRTDLIARRRQGGTALPTAAGAGHAARGERAITAPRVA